MSTPNNINDEEKLQFNKSQSQLLHQPNLSGTNEQDQLQKTDNHYIYSTGAKIGQGFLIGLGIVLFLGGVVLMAHLIPTVGAVPFLDTASTALGTLGTVVISTVGNLVGIGMVTVGGIWVDLSRKAEKEEQEKINEEQNKIEGKQEGKNENENDNNKNDINEQINKRINNKGGIDKNIINSDNDKREGKNIWNDNSNEKENDKNDKKERKKEEKQKGKIEQQKLNNNDIDPKKNKNINKGELNMQEKYNKHKLNQLDIINISKFQSEAFAFVKNTKLAYKNDIASKKKSEAMLKKNIGQNYNEAIKSYQFYENIMNSKSSGVISHKISNISINKHQNREESEYVRGLLKADENNSERNDEDKYDNEFQNKPNDLHYVEDRKLIEQMIKDNPMNNNEAEKGKKINKEQNNKGINNKEDIDKSIDNNKEEKGKNTKEKQKENHDSKESNDNINNSEKERKEEKEKEIDNNEGEKAKKTEDNKENKAAIENNNSININKENQENKNNRETNDQENTISSNNKNNTNNNEKEKEKEKEKEGDTLIMNGSTTSKFKKRKPKKPSLHWEEEQTNKEKNEKIKKENDDNKDINKKENKEDKKKQNQEEKIDDKREEESEKIKNEDNINKNINNDKERNLNEETEQGPEKKKENAQILNAINNNKNNQVVSFINTELLDIAQNIDIDVDKTMEEIDAYKNKRKDDYDTWFFRHNSDNPANNVDLNEQKKYKDNKDNEENDNLINRNESSSVQYSDWFDRHSEKTQNSAVERQKNNTESNIKTSENVNKNNNDVEGKNKKIGSEDGIKDNIKKEGNVESNVIIPSKKAQYPKETKESDRINEINNHTNNQLVNPVSIGEEKLEKEDMRNNMKANDNKKKTDVNSDNMTDQGKNTNENKEKGETKQNEFKQFFTSVFETTEKTKRKNCDNESNTETEKANTADTKKIKNEGIKHGKFKQLWTKTKNGIVDWIKRKPGVQKQNLSIPHGGNNLKKTLLSKFRWSKNQNQNQNPILNEDTCKDK